MGEIEKFRYLSWNRTSKDRKIVHQLCFRTLNFRLSIFLIISALDSVFYSSNLVTVIRTIYWIFPLPFKWLIVFRRVGQGHVSTLLRLELVETWKPPIFNALIFTTKLICDTVDQTKKWWKLAQIFESLLLDTNHVFNYQCSKLLKIGYIMRSFKAWKSTSEIFGVLSST